MPCAEKKAYIISYWNFYLEVVFVPVYHHKYMVKLFGGFFSLSLSVRPSKSSAVRFSGEGSWRRWVSVTHRRSRYLLFTQQAVWISEVTLWIVSSAKDGWWESTSIFFIVVSTQWLTLQVAYKLSPPPQIADCILRMVILFLWMQHFQWEHAFVAYSNDLFNVLCC